MKSAATVMVVLGTRPEAVKLAPVIRTLREARDLRPVVVVSGQHRGIMDEVLQLFEIVPDHDLAVLRPRQSLTHLTTKALEGLAELIEAERPDVIVVQGDTTTTFAASLAGFYSRVPVIHVEAGLRSGHRRAPYPEEMNRQLTSRLADMHLCPTWSNRENLVKEGVDPASIIVTGNTVIDALHWVVSLNDASDQEALVDHRKLILVTAHRRESWDGGLAEIAQALRDVVADRRDVRVLFPIHPNPLVRDVMIPILDPLPNVEVVEPLGYLQFLRAMACSYVIVSDSGGVQEEGPSLGVPVLVTRENTERPEAVEEGTVRLVGTRRDEIAKQLILLLDDSQEYERMRRSVNPYGDGDAARRAVDAIRHLLCGGPRPTEFEPRASRLGVDDSHLLDRHAH
jgi:UDP-N-acetylglucosamine 2-epimerase (non-hydrolysing)